LWIPARYICRLYKELLYVSLDMFRPIPVLSGHIVPWCPRSPVLAVSALWLVCMPCPEDTSMDTVLEVDRRKKVPSGSRSPFKLEGPSKYSTWTSFSFGKLHLMQFLCMEPFETGKPAHDQNKRTIARCLDRNRHPCSCKSCCGHQTGAGRMRLSERPGEVFGKSDVSQDSHGSCGFRLGTSADYNPNRCMFHACFVGYFPACPNSVRACSCLVPPVSSSRSVRALACLRAMPRGHIHGYGAGGRQTKKGSVWEPISFQT
jgi:hypothetical protein